MLRGLLFANSQMRSIYRGLLRELSGGSVVNGEPLHASSL